MVTTAAERAVVVEAPVPPLHAPEESRGLRILLDDGRDLEPGAVQGAPPVVSPAMLPDALGAPRAIGHIAPHLVERGVDGDATCTGDRADLVSAVFGMNATAHEPEPLERREHLADHWRGDAQERREVDLHVLTPQQ